MKELESEITRHEATFNQGDYPALSFDELGPFMARKREEFSGGPFSESGDASESEAALQSLMKAILAAQRRQEASTNGEEASGPSPPSTLDEMERGTDGANSTANSESHKAIIARRIATRRAR